MKKPVRLALHAIAAAYVLPALFIGGVPPSLATPLGIYRISAGWVLLLVGMYWNFVYWFSLFPRNLARLAPKTRQATGAEVVIGSRGVRFDRNVGWREFVVLQVRYFALLIATFVVWSVFVLAAVVLVLLLVGGKTGVRAFFNS